MPEIQFKGKEFVFNHHLSVPYRPLAPNKEKSIGAGNVNDNLIVHGDNLHALKALMPMYAGLIDCVFIDPPYNTGNESWSYNDNVNSPIMKEWLTSNPINKEDMLRHDKWLAMMYPRIKLLHELLAATGVIWITLDDNEIHHARMVMNEIFGERNFLAQLAWEKVYSPRMDADGFSKDHDTVLAYAKNKDEAILSTQFIEQNEKQFTYIEPVTERKARLRSLRKEGSDSLRSDRENCWYLIEAPDGTPIYPIKPDGTEGRWRWERPTFIKEMAKKNPSVLIQKNEAGRWDVVVKQYYKGEAEQPISTILKNTEYGHTHEATEEIKQIFGSKAFPTPKPCRLVEGLIDLVAPVDGIVLDSFAGSGTTAHAVLRSNKRNNFNRKFILVECENYADEITAERVRRIINGYSFSGVVTEDLHTESITFTSLKKSNKILDNIKSIENLDGHRFDVIKKEIKDGILTVYGEKAIKKKVDGLGGSFTYCTLGDPLDIDKILTGENLPDYNSIGSWLFHTATGESLSSNFIRADDFYLGESSAYYIWLIYKNDLDFLKSRDSALTFNFAEKIAQKKGKRHLVFATAKYVPNKTLLPLGVEFAPLPFALYRVEK